MTKAEKTLDDNLRKKFILHRDMSYQPGIDAMRQHAMEFAEWCGDRWWKRENDLWSDQDFDMWNGNPGQILKTTSELYDIFNNQNS